MNIKKRILGFALAVTIMLSGLNTVPERVKADTSNPKAQAEVIPSPAKSSATMAIGATKQIKINNLKKTMKVTYKSDMPKTVKVSKKGKITALKAGRANISITVRTKTGEIKYGYAVIVKKPSFKQKKLNLIKGKSKTFKVKNISKQAKVIWKSSNKKVVTVSAKGSVKAINKGKADISAVIKVAGKTYILKQKVTVNNKPTLAIKVSNKLDDKKKALIKTTDENIVIKGKITGKNKLKKLSITYTDHTNKPANIKPSGKRNWSVNVPLSIGRTRVKITAEGKKKEKVTKVISINRTNKTIEYSANVKTADIKEAAEVSDSVVKSFKDDNNTPDRVSDDTIVVLVKEDSELLRKINAGELQQGNAYVLPQVEHFIAGFTGIYNRHQAPRDSEYPDYAYEEVIFNYPTIDKLFDKDINLDFSGGIDKENPVAFTLIGDKTTINPKANGGQIGMTNKVRAMGYGDDDNYPSPGFQREEFFKQLGTPKISESLKREEKTTAPTDGRSKPEQSTGYDIKLNWEDVVIYDQDGVKNKEGDTSGEILLSGEIGVENLRHEGGIVWEKGEVSPKQLQSKVKFDFVDNLEIKGTVISLTTEELVKTLNRDFENEIKVAGINISGVETFKNKWVIGAVGIRLESETFVAGDLNRIAEQSYDPTVMFFIFMDIDGKITVEGGIESKKSSSFTLGFNLQKNDFEGSLGTLAENKGNDRFEVKDYTLDIYRNKETERTTTVSGSMEADLTTGIGIGAGLMVFGISPAVITGEIYTQNKISAKLEGVLSLPDSANPKDKKMEMTGEGEIELLSEVGAKAEMEFRLAAEFGIWEKEVVYKKEWDKKFAELTQEFSYKFGKEKENKEEKKEEEKQQKPDDKTVENFIKGVEAKAKAKGYLKPVTLMDYEGTKIKALVSKNYKKIKVYGINNEKNEFYIDLRLFTGIKRETLLIDDFKMKNKLKGIYPLYSGVEVTGEVGVFEVDFINDKSKDFKWTQSSLISRDKFGFLQRHPALGSKLDHIPKKFYKGGLWIDYGIDYGGGDRDKRKDYSDGKGGYNSNERIEDKDNTIFAMNLLAGKKRLKKGWYDFDKLLKNHVSPYFYGIRNIKKIK